MHVDVVRHGEDSSIRFRIKDTGIGISEEQAQRLFQPFSQADASTTREYGGSGLGLVISKRFVEMMQGEIGFESSLGEGTTFSVTIPQSKAFKRTPAKLAVMSSAPLVLIIDDDASMLDMFSRSLSERGFEVCCAQSGEEGIQVAARLRPKVIVLDVKMPGMSGWEVLSTLKLDSQTAGIPVIMITVLEQEDIGRALGASDYLLKPIDPTQLMQAIEQHVSSSETQVLVVEDDEPTRTLMCRTLTSAGHRVLQADNGQVALGLLERETPDLIVLDLMMPVMDGFDFLHHMRQDSRIAHIPTIVATARCP